MYRIAVAIESYQANSEDRAQVIETAEGIVIVVADGVGGQSGGGAAAELAVSLIRESTPGLLPPDWIDSLAWADLVTQADQGIFSAPEAGMTTCILVALPNAEAGSLFGASVGDSEAWIVTANDWTDLTEHQAALGKSFVGRGDAAGVPFFGMLKPNDTLLVATDGLFKYADADNICAAARQDDLASAAGDLINLVRFPNGGRPDDIAVVLCRPA